MKKISLILIAASSLVVLWFLRGIPFVDGPDKENQIFDTQENSTGIPVSPETAVEDPETLAREKIQEDLEAARAEESLPLTSGNFESFVLRCFQGEPCRFQEDPLVMFQNFTRAGNDRAVDSLISFMRSRLKNADFKAKYKDILKQMIYDYYRPEERQFQEAAYYSYLGDLQKSLDLYLDLKEKFKTNPNLHEAPNLNIANVLYDMKRYKEALPYYQAALREHLSGAIKVDPSPVGFIEDRIEELSQSKN